VNVQEYFDTLHELWDGQIVICALGTNTDEWWRRTGDDGCFYLNGAMGFAPSMALGLALSVPDREVWVLDSDGGAVMNIGGFLTEASVSPGNLTHFLLDNRCYGCLGGHPLVNTDRTDYVGLARAAGIDNVHDVRDVESCRAAVAACKGLDKHGFVVAAVDFARAEGEAFERPLSMGYEGPEMTYRFGRAMERLTGRAVFGPRGY
jgi:thiamine pyrophosphate-dependent acetolactate synthase large subunit-like protein